MPRQKFPRDRIIRLASRPQGFGVSWKDSEKLLRRCNRMVEEGLLAYDQNPNQRLGQTKFRAVLDVDR